MGRPIPVTKICKDLEMGCSYNQISRKRRTSKRSIKKVVDAIGRNPALTLAGVSKMSLDEAYQLLFPDTQNSSDYFEKPDYSYIHKELTKKGVTLLLLYMEFCDEHPNSVHRLPSYSKFCRDYRIYTEKKNIANHLDYRPGMQCQVDWAGATMHYTTQKNKQKKVYIFVATLPYSQLTYVEATEDMKMNSWILCNIHMFEYFGGVTSEIICDNLKTGVISHPADGEIVLNEEYEAFSLHYQSAILPARVRKPRDKNSVEGNVGNITQAILAKARNTDFYSLNEIRDYVSRQLEVFNNTPFQKRDGSRRSVFESQEQDYLRPLPAQRYELSEWIYNRKIGLNSYATYKKNFYSVPWKYIGETVDFKVSERKIEIYTKYSKIAEHPLFGPEEKNKYATDKSHLPKDPSKLNMNKQRIMEWAHKIGPACKQVIEKIFEDCQIEQQGYNPALAILRLSNKYSPERLEKACETALDNYIYPRYSQIHPLLSLKIDEISDKKKASEAINAASEKGLIRGSTYYKKKKWK